jgi:hypothetical protein
MPGDLRSTKVPGDLGAPKVPGDLGAPKVPGDLGAPQMPGDLRSTKVPGDLRAAASCQVIYEPEHLGLWPGGAERESALPSDDPWAGADCLQSEACRDDSFTICVTAL